MKKKKNKGLFKQIEDNILLIIIALIVIFLLFNNLQPQSITGSNIVYTQEQSQYWENGQQPADNTPTDTTPPVEDEEDSDIHWWECEANRIEYSMDYQNITPRTSSACQTYGTTYCNDIGMEYDGLAFMSPNCCMWNCKAITPTGTNYTAGECASIANSTGKGWSQILFTHTAQACYDYSQDICIDYGWFLADAVHYPNNCCVWNCN